MPKDGGLAFGGLYDVCDTRTLSDVCRGDHSGQDTSRGDLLHEKGFNHQAETRTGVLREDCSRMLSDFFRELRLQKAEKKLQKPIQEKDTDVGPSELR